MSIGYICGFSVWQELCASFTSCMHTNVERDNDNWGCGVGGGGSSLIHDDLVRSLYRSAGTRHHRRRKRSDLPSAPPSNAFDGPQLVYEDECPRLAYRTLRRYVLSHHIPSPRSMFFHRYFFHVISINY